MKVSVNWIKEYLDFELPGLDELAKKIGSQLGAIEEVESLADRYQGVVIVRLAKCVDHPNSDHLHICSVDDGGAVPDVPRDENGHVTVVTGAANVHDGMLAAWLPPKSAVPETYGKEPFVLEARELRGVLSNGMLASARELDLGTDHTGILELETDAKPGDDFAKAFKLDDVIIDIENKMFTHRPDLFGELGVAREIAGILNQPFTSPEWYKSPRQNVLEKADTLPLEVRNELPELVPRFMAVAMHVGRLGPSPLWLRSALTRAGLRSINNVVDITNYMMMLTGQPLHAYDYDKVKALSGDDKAVLAVRYPKPAEKLKLLNGKEVEPRAEAIMIATDKQAIGLGGVMGGADTEVDENTKNIILECATFDMYSIRKTSMAHGLFTDAVTRYNKGQSPLQNDRIVGESLRLFGELAAATQASDIIDDNYVAGREWVHPPVTVSAEFINTRLGLHLSAGEMKQLLENVESTVEVSADNLTVTAPSWRTDIELREDVVEEIGRLYGYDHLPLDLPKRAIAPVKKDELLELKARVRAELAKAGANEVLTYTFVHGNLLEKAGQDKSQAFQVSNAISPDLQYYRLSLTPSLLEKVHPNTKAGYSEFALFEIGKAHTVSEHEQDGVPREVNALSLVITTDDKAAKAKHAGAAYYQARKQLVSLLAEFNVPGSITLVPLATADLYNNPWIIQMCAPYQPTRSAVLRDEKGLIWGVVGEFKSSVRAKLKLPAYTAGFEIDPLLLTLSPSTKNYVPLPRFPKVEQDLCLKVPNDKTYAEVYSFVWRRIGELRPEQTYDMLGPVDIYQREDDKEHKQITLRLTIASYERTLTDEEVTKLLDAVAAAARDQLGAERV